MLFTASFSFEDLNKAKKKTAKVPSKKKSSPAKKKAVKVPTKKKNSTAKKATSKKSKEAAKKKVAKRTASGKKKTTGSSSKAKKSTATKTKKKSTDSAAGKKTTAAKSSGATKKKKVNQPDEDTAMDSETDDSIEYGSPPSPTCSRERLADMFLDAKQDIYISTERFFHPDDI